MSADELPLLSVRGLTVAFPTKSGLTVAVHDVSFDVERGSCLGLVGESGCGKSVTLRALVDLVPRPGRTLSGEVLWDQQDLLRVRPREIERVRGTDISMIFQDATVSLNPVLSIGDQISEVLRVKLGTGGAPHARRRCGCLIGWGFPHQDAVRTAIPMNSVAACVSGS